MTVPEPSYAVEDRFIPDEAVQPMQCPMCLGPLADVLVVGATVHKDESLSTKWTWLVCSEGCAIRFVNDAWAGNLEGVTPDYWNVLAPSTGSPS